MQYPPFSSPPIKVFVQKALSTDIKYSNTYLARFEIWQPHFVWLPTQGFSLRFSAAVVGWVKLLPTLTAAPQQSPRHRHSFSEQRWPFSTRFCRVRRTWLHTIVHAIVHVLIHCFWCILLGETFLRLFLILLRNRWFDPSFDGCSSTLSCTSFTFATNSGWHILQRSGSFLSAGSLGASPSHTTFVPTVVFLLWRPVVVLASLAFRVRSDAFAACAILVSGLVPRAHSFLTP